MLIEELDARGLYQECTDRAGLTELLATHAPVSVYAGYDPTSSSLHVGNLVPTIMLKRMQLAGHRPIVVVGGATGMIGDPSGKSAERNLLDDATLATNIAGIHAQLSKLMVFDSSPTGAVIVNNADWTRGVSFLEFLRDVGKYLTINWMMAKDSVKSRLDGEMGISYTEFSYMLLQAFDFVHLAKQYGCRLQVGGSDQYGNITAGCELARKRGDLPQLFGLVAPLLLDSTGQKMGKTSTGERIWLDAERTTPYAFYQYWFNRPDGEVPKLLRMFSLEPVARVEEILEESAADPGKRIAQRELARGMTSGIHGDGVIKGIEDSASDMFSDITKLSDAQLANMAGTVPSFDVPKPELEAGVLLVDLLLRVQLEKSKGDARRTITQGGAYVNDVAVKDPMKKLTLADLMTETRLVLRKGKKTYAIVRVV